MIAFILCFNHQIRLFLVVFRFERKLEAEARGRVCVTHDHAEIVVVLSEIENLIKLKVAILEPQI